MTSPALPLFQELKTLITTAKQRVAVAVNAELTLLYWQIGQRISHEILQGERAEYGKEIVPQLSKQLTAEFGKGWSPQQLRHCVRFAEVFPDGGIVSTLSRQLHWSPFFELLYLKEPLARQFYLELCTLEHWSVRMLRKQVGSLLFERTALSKQPEALIEERLQELQTSGQLQPDFILKDPYILDFLNLNDRYIEKNLEDAILREMEKFILEMGAGFSFIARQKRLQIDNDDFYLDLLFYNRKLKRLIAIELKTEPFRHAHKSQMELYLRWLAKYEQEPDEASPLGIILCTGKKQEQIELLELDQCGIHVAEYLTQLPPKALLEARLQEAVKNARLRLGTDQNQLEEKGDWDG